MADFIVNWLPFAEKKLPLAALTLYPAQDSDSAAWSVRWSEWQALLTTGDCLPLRHGHKEESNSFSVTAFVSSTSSQQVLSTNHQENRRVAEVRGRITRETAKRAIGG